MSSYSRLVTWAAYASSGVAFILIVVKLIAWIYTDSASILASLTDSLLDITASLVNLAAIRYALTPPDDEHRYGHGKAESLAGLAQSAFISGSALFLIFNGLSRLLHNDPISNPMAGIWVTVFAIIITLVLVTFQNYVIKKTDSVAIQADQLHYKSDLFLNAAVLLAIGLTWYGWYWADGLFAMLIGVYILYGALQIAGKSVQVLLDRRLPKEEQERIVQICLNTEGVQGMHDLRTRRSGPTRFIQLHIELDDHLSLRKAHDISVIISKAIHEEFDDADVMIHLDPVSLYESGEEEVEFKREF